MQLSEELEITANPNFGKIFHPNNYCFVFYTQKEAKMTYVKALKSRRDNERKADRYFPVKDQTKLLKKLNHKVEKEKIKLPQLIK